MAVADRSRGLAPRPRGRASLDADSSTYWLLGVIVALGILVRFPTLGEQSFWYDEATTWGIVAHGLGHVLATVPKTESTPPLYYVLLWLWAQVFGLGDAGLRAFSALCSTLTIPVVWMIGRRLISNRVGLVAALLTAVNPLLFWYAQEARSYSLLLLLSALSLLALVRALESPSPKRVLIWGLASALALAAHYYAAVVIVPEAAWLGVTLHRQARLTPRRVALGIVPVLAVGVALMPLAIRQNDGRASYIATQGGSLPYRVAQLFKEDIIGMGQPMKALLGVVGCLLVLVGLGLLVRRSQRSERSACRLLFAVGAGGVVLGILIAAVGTDYFNTRNLIPTWPALFLLVAAGLGAPRAGRVGALATTALVLLSLLCVWNIISNPLFQRPNWRGAAQILGSSSVPRAVVSDIQSQVPLEPYLRGVRQYPISGERVREVDLVWVERSYQWGPIAPVTPLPLAGFPDVHVIRTNSYVVVRYRSPTPQAESAQTLDHLYPIASRALTLLQQKSPRY